MDRIYWILAIVATVSVCHAGRVSRARRQATTQDVCADYCDFTPDVRDLCPATPQNTPGNRVNTTANLLELRTVMRDTTLTGGQLLDAYLVYEGSYYGGGVTEHDRRMNWVSGFSGSSGHVVVTFGSQPDIPNRAALWSDGRYWLQADQEMDCNWIMMKDGATGTPSSETWLIDILPDGAKVGVDASYIDTTTWREYEEAFAASSKDIQLFEVPTDLFDFIWTAEDGRPPVKNTPIYEHTIDYAGVTWQDKVLEARAAIDGVADVMIMTLLDDIAWMLNMRAADRDTSPLFDSVVFLQQSTISLYIREPATKLSAIATHLNTGADGSCAGQTGVCVDVLDYDNYLTDIEALNANAAINKIWINIGVTYAVYQAAGKTDETKRYEDYSPLQLPKSQKNPTEVQRYRDCQIRDSSYVCEFMSILEKGVKAGEYWTEMSADANLTGIRATDPAFRMVSFYTIAAFGTNGAVIHYRPAPATDKQITTDDMFLLDSGGNYLDATTDVTRTFHFGTPTAKNIEVYTRVLLGTIELATTVWPFGWKGSDIDARTRTPIWQNGWDFNHGTGHGIGYFLNVHEGPGRIAMGNDEAHEPLHEHQFYSDEPGIYLDGEFGVRLETIVEVVLANTTYRFNDKDYMTFDPVTFVPFEPNLIDYSLLETHHRVWLNWYHKRCNVTTGAYLLANNKQAAYDWLVARTALVPEVPTWGAAAQEQPSTTDSAPVMAATWSLVLVTLAACTF